MDKLWIKGEIPVEEAAGKSFVDNKISVIHRGKSQTYPGKVRKLWKECTQNGKLSTSYQRAVDNFLKMIFRYKKIFPWNSEENT